MENKLKEYFDAIQEKLDHVRTLTTLNCFRDSEEESEGLEAMIENLTQLLGDIASVNEVLNALTTKF